MRPGPEVGHDLASEVLLGRLQQHDRRALAQLLTLIENQQPGYEDIIRGLHEHSGRAVRVGITGQPGAGKSTLVAGLATELRSRGQTVGILAVDPSSPFTKGAVLGDRIRMQDLLRDSGIFVRSMASRGQPGGLAAGVIDAVTVLDAFGMDVVLVETVGAGQDEVDIMRVAQSIVVVEIPGAGDAVQTLKAGLLEIADIYVVNKSDHSGADAVASRLKQLISLVPEQPWRIPVIKTIATTGEGVPALVDAIGEHQVFLRESGGLAAKRRAEARYQVRSLVEKKLVEFLDSEWDASGLLEDAAGQVADRVLDPHTAATLLIESADWSSLHRQPHGIRNGARGQRGSQD